MARKKHTAAKRLSPAKIRAEEARYMMKTYRRPPEVFTHGRGCRLYDSQGREYLDFLAGIAVNATGYAHPRMVRVIRREAGRATHVSNLFHNPYQAPLARKLAEWSGLDRVFFSNSGSEAIEGALKLARAYAHAKSDGGARLKTRFLALENSFHGRTFGALSITHTAKYREPFAPLVPGAEFVRFNDVADLEAKFDDTVCAIVIEPVQGEGGVFVVSEEFWERARALATQHGAALIADEIQSGLGRTGWRFAYQKFGSLPDIVTVAKPLACGLPLGAILTTERVASCMHPGMHGTTFGGGPLTCAVAIEFLHEEKKLLEHVGALGKYFRAALEGLDKIHKSIQDVRGAGLMQAVELDSSELAKAVAKELLQKGIIINRTHETVLRFLPSYIIEKKHVDQLVKALDAALAKHAESGRPEAALPKRKNATTLEVAHARA